jgi:hypothetical protein
VPVACVGSGDCAVRGSAQPGSRIRGNVSLVTPVVARRSVVLESSGYGPAMDEGIVGPVAGATHTTFGPVEIEVGGIGDARIKRMTYPPGMRWSTDLRPLVGTERCEHGHAGFLVQGALHFEFEDGCVLEFVAPAVVEVAPGHDAWVVGDRPAVLIEVDFETATIERLGLPESHRHD